MSTPITDAIVRYEANRPDHRSGTLDLSVLRELERLLPRNLEHTMETGCGKTTILFSRLSSRHTVFTFDDTAFENGSIEYFRACPDFNASSTTLVLGATQQTLKSFDFDAPLDLACLDGPHAYPFPELEYYYVYPHIRPGGWLIVDDIHIPTVHRMFEFLREDDMFGLVAVVKTTAAFRRRDSPTFDPLGDGWLLQRFNAARFPVALGASHSVAPPEASLTSQLVQLQTELQQMHEQLQWWQHAADERRLKRRLERRLQQLRRFFGS